MKLEEYKELAKNLAKARHYIEQASQIVTGFRKSDLNLLIKIYNLLNRFRCRSEDMMFKEHIDASTSIFFPAHQYYDSNAQHSAPEIWGCEILYELDPYSTERSFGYFLAHRRHEKIFTKSGKRAIREVKKLYMTLTKEEAKILKPFTKIFSLREIIDLIEKIRRTRSPSIKLPFLEYVKQWGDGGEKRKEYEEWLKSSTMQEAKQLYEKEKRKRQNFCPVCNIIVPNTVKNRNIGYGALACPRCLTVVNWKGSRIPHHEFELTDTEGSLGIQYNPKGFGYPWLWHAGCKKGEYGQDKTIGHFRIEKLWIDPDSKLRDKEKNWSARLVLGLRCEQCDLVNCLKFGIYGTPKAIPIYVSNGDPNRILIIEDARRKRRISIKRIKMELEQKEYEGHLKESLEGFLTKEEMLAAARERATGEKYRRSAD